MKKILFLSLLTIATRADVICEKASECPENVGQVIISDNGFKVCTGFLIKEDVVATNLHCVPEALKTAGAGCSKIIKIQFPGQKSAEVESNECDKVLFLSAPLQNNSLNVDLALFKFKKSFGRKVLRVSQEGFPFKSEYDLYKIDPIPKGGVLKKISCLPKPNSILNPYFTTEKSPIVNFNPCVAVKGNSGSPILSKEGFVRGMLSSGGGLGVKDPNQEMNTVFGSNFSCVNLSFLGYPSQNLSACEVQIDEKNEKKLAQQMIDSENSKLIKTVEERLQFEKRFKDSDMRLFQWNLVSESREEDKNKKADSQGEYFIREMLFMLKPKCIAMKNIPAEILRKKFKNGFFEISFDLPEFAAKQKVGSKLELAADLSEKNINYRTKVSAQELFNSDRVRFEVERSDLSKFSWDLNHCE